MSTDGGGTWTDIAGATLPTYDFTASAAENGRQYRAVFTNLAGKAVTSAATLTVGFFPGRVACGQMITTNTTLGADLPCPDSLYALAIGAPNLTLDLGGHVLSGSTAAGNPGVGVLVNGFNGTTIRNGSIRDFDLGISVSGARNVRMEDLSISNLRALDPSHRVTGALITRTSGAVVRDSQFGFSSNGNALAILESDVSVGNITVEGDVGVVFGSGGACDPNNWPNKGEVLNSRFAGSGLRINCGTGVRIAGNEFDCAKPGYCVGVLASAATSGDIVGLIAEGNRIRNPYIGFDLQGVTQSAVTNNTVAGSTGWGIALRQSPAAGGGTVNPPAGNTISDNLAWGNATDLYDDDSGKGNAWARNVCATKQGLGIAACAALTVITHPASQRVAAGATASFTASATYAGGAPNPPAVQWQVSANGGLTWSYVAGAAQATYSFTAGASDSGKQYRAVFTNGAGTATTSAATLTVDAAPSAPAVTSHPADQSLLPGQRASFSASASGTPTPALRWQVSANGGSKWVDLVTGVASPVYSFLAAASDDRKQFRGVFTNSAGTAVTNAARLGVGSISAVVNAASLQPGISPGAWVSILGTDLATTTRGWNSEDAAAGRLPMQLDGVSVKINGMPAAVSYVSPTQLDVQAPDDETIGSVPIEVVTPHAALTAKAPLQTFLPGLFTFDGTYVAAYHEDYTKVGRTDLLPGETTTPARIGEVVTIWGTGFGPSNPPSPAGQVVAQAADLANAVTVRIAGVRATVRWAGISSAGLCQMDVVVPTGTADGDWPVVAEVGGVQSQSRALITVRR
jgi:uncharacterized protein (TIGR03437 family)